MSLQVEQAIIGYYKGSHQLVNSSIPREQLPLRLSDFSDLPTSLPSSVKQLPVYTSGLPIDDFFVFTRTFQIPSKRGGSVFTHALLVNRSDVGRFRNLDDVFSRFLTVPNFEAPLSSLQITPTHPKEIESIAQLPNIADALITQSKSVVWEGNQHFESIIKKLWASIWAQGRELLSFHLSLSPEDIKTFQPTIVFVPKNISKRYHGFPRFSPGSKPIKVKNKAIKLLLGQSEGLDLLAFIENLGIRLDGFSRLSRIEGCLDDYLKLDKLELSEIRGLAASIGYYSPNKKNGQEIKQKVISKLSERTRLPKKPSIEDVGGLYNFKYSAYLNSEKIITETIADWVTRQAAKIPDTDYLELAEILGDTKDEEAPKSWKKGITNGLSSFFSKSTEAAIFFWKILQSVPDALVNLNEFIPQNYQGKLLKAFPETIHEKTGTVIMNWCKERNWYRLFAAAAQGIFPLEMALKKVLQVEKSGMEGLSEIRQRTQPLSFIQTSITLNSQRLITVCAEMIVQEPDLLQHIQVTKKGWLEIWAEATTMGNPIFKGIKQPKDAYFALLDLMLERAVVAPILLQKIVETSDASILAHPKRKSLWKILPYEVQSPIISATIEEVLEFKIKLSSLEDKIVEGIFSKEEYLRSFIKEYPIASVIQKLNERSVKEKVFKAFLMERKNEHFSLPEATSIGKIVYANRWENCASKIFEDGKRNKSLLVAIKGCKRLLKTWERWSLYRYIDDEDDFSEKDWWKEIVDLFTELYPKGPEEKNIWERAKGDLSLLTNNKSGKEMWREAFRLLKNGGGGKDDMKISDLLWKARRDFPKNNLLTTFEELYKKKMKRKYE